MGTIVKIEFNQIVEELDTFEIEELIEKLRAYLDSKEKIV